MYYDKSAQKVRVCAGSRVCVPGSDNGQDRELTIRAHRAAARANVSGATRPPALGSHPPYLYTPCPTHSEPERFISNG